MKPIFNVFFKWTELGGLVANLILQREYSWQDKLRLKILISIPQSYQLKEKREKLKKKIIYPGHIKDHCG